MTKYMIALAGLLVAPLALAQHSAHVHGEGKLNIAIEGDEVVIELIAPGVDIVGFEHAPENDADRSALADGAAKLGNAAALFVFPDVAGCKVVEAEIEAPYEDDHGHGDHNHGDHGHGDKDAQHAEFHAHYHIECTKIGALSYIDVNYFEHFPNAHELDVQLVGDKGQAGAELSADRNRLEF